MDETAGQKSSNGQTTDTPDDDRPDWMTPQDVAHLTGKSPRTIRRWCKKGKVEARKNGRGWEIKADTIPRNLRTEAPDVEPPDRTTAELSDRMTALAERKGYLEHRVQQLEKQLPSGEEQERLDRLEKVLQKVAYTPFARYLIPADLREELTASN